MMPQAWFTPKSATSQLAPSNAKPQANQPPIDAKLSKELMSSEAGSSRPSVDRAITAALSTPHDAVLAELQGQRPVPITSAKIDASPEAPVLPTILSQNEGLTATSSPVSTSAGTSGSVEPIYDPSTGAVAFSLPPLLLASGSTTPGSAPFEQAKDELWSQLGRIRELQSEIARRHLQMEGIGGGAGAGEGGRTGIPKKPPPRTHTDTIVVGEEWPDPAEEVSAKKTAQDAEFDNLAKAFEGRQNSIQGIMDKLDELSKVLTTFHALPTPAMNFAARNNTKDSMATFMSSPSSTFATVPTSPLASPTLPNFVPTSLRVTMEEALEIPRAESPVPHDEL